MGVIAGAYLRKSNSEGQTSVEMKSVSRQLDEVRRFAESKAWTLDERYVYKDGEISGEEWVKRPGYQALRAALVKPPFKVMIVWEQSRFGRDTARQLTAIQEVRKKRADQLRDERAAAEAELETLSVWARDEAADRDRAEELRAKWSEWSEALEDDPVLARQVLGKALAGAPIYVRPGQQKRTWFFLGLASYEGVIRGAVRPGAIATYVEDPAPLIERGAAPVAVREALAVLAGLPEGGTILPASSGERTYTLGDFEALTAVPMWARPRADRGTFRSGAKTGKRARKQPRPIAGASDAPESSDAGAQSGPPCPWMSGASDGDRRATPARPRDRARRALGPTLARAGKSPVRTPSACAACRTSRS